MSKKPWVSFKEWLKPHQARAKALGVKFTRKNKDKAFSAYIDWAFRRHEGEGYGPLNLLFKCVYSDALEDSLLIYNNNPFLDRIKPVSGDIWSQPVIIGPEHGWKDDSSN